MKKKTKTFMLPEIPVGHLTMVELDRLVKVIKEITGHQVRFELVDKKTKKVLAFI